MKLDHGTYIWIKHSRNWNEIELAQAGPMNFLKSWRASRESSSIQMVRGDIHHSKPRWVVMSFCPCLQDMQGMEKALERWGITGCCWPSAIMETLWNFDNDSPNGPWMSQHVNSQGVSEGQRKMVQEQAARWSFTGVARVFRLWKVSICRFWLFLLFFLCSRYCCHLFFHYLHRDKL